jgi:hypothetical protein
MCGLPLRGSSKQTVYVDSRPEEERSRLLLPKHQLQELDDENTNIFCSNAFDRYRNRPEFESLTFAEFSSWYSSSNKNSNSIELKNGCGLIRKRKSEIMLRTPKLTSITVSTVH